MSPERCLPLATFLSYGLSVTAHVPESIRILALAFGCAFAALGLWGFVKFGGQLLQPPDEEHRNARLPAVLILGRPVGIGAGFIVFGITSSWVALGFGVACWMTEGPVARWTMRRLGQSLD